MSGKELDCTIAEFMGWVWINHQGRKVLVPPEGDKRRYLTALWDESGLPHYLPKYSSNMSDTWTIIDQFESYTLSQTNEREHTCKVLKGGVWYIGIGESVTLAICNAAMKSTYVVEVVS